MPGGPGCVTCAGGEWQCGPDTNDLCLSSVGWTPAGALCLQFYLMKHPRTGKCVLKIEPKPLASCGSAASPGKVWVSIGEPQVVAGKATRKKSTKAVRKRKAR